MFVCLLQWPFMNGSLHFVLRRATGRYEQVHAYHPSELVIERRCILIIVLFKYTVQIALLTSHTCHFFCPRFLSYCSTSSVQNLVMQRRLFFNIRIENIRTFAEPS